MSPSYASYFIYSCISHSIFIFVALPAFLSLCLLYLLPLCFWRCRTMASESPSIFRPFLQEFFVKASDPLFTCTLKLEVLTQLATKDNCGTILGELQTYVLHRDKSFVCAAVRAVGRVADARPEVAEQCLQVKGKGREGQEGQPICFWGRTSDGR